MIAKPINRQRAETLHNIVRTLSKLGVCSRKEAVKFVQQGRVRLNGKVVLEPGKKISPIDKILFDGRPISEKRKRCILFHKPAGCLTTRSDEKGRRTVYHYLKGIDGWVFPVGRLDKDSEGLLIFTNDTGLGNVLTDPRHRILRTYEVTVSGVVSNCDLDNIIKGVEIGKNEKSQPVNIEVLTQCGSTTCLKVQLIEGKNREIRRLFEKLGKPVKRLIRTQYGPFRLGEIKPGEWVEIKGKIGFADLERRQYEYR